MWVYIFAIVKNILNIMKSNEIVIKRKILNQNFLLKYEEKNNNNK